MRRFIKVLLYIALIFGCIWLTTLGVFVRRTVTRTLSEPVEIVDAKHEHLHVRTYAVECQHVTFGVPYVYFLMQDGQPYGISLIFSAEASRVESVFLDSVAVRGKPSVLASPVELTKSIIPFDSSVVFRKTFFDVFQDANHQEIEIRGWLTKADGTLIQFQQSLRVPFVRDTDMEIGWFHLFYAQF